MTEGVLYRCIEPACGRSWPRKVNFCPYCGTAQEAGLERGAVAAHAVLPAGAAAAAEPIVVPAATAAAPAASAVPDQPAPAPTPGPAPGPAPAPAATPASAFRAKLDAARPAPGVRAASALPPRRKPVRLRWWLLALVLLWAVWLVANPGKRRVEAQMDKAIGLATACKPREAQNELIALRKTRATPGQLQHVQEVLNDAAGDCTRKRQRDKAWREARTAVESALSASSFDKARQRLRAFTKRWGEDGASRALGDKIEARDPEHPRADELR